MKIIFSYLLKEVKCNLIDLFNFTKYGNKAIRKYSTTWINPLEINYSTRFFSPRKIPQLYKFSDELHIGKIKNKLRTFISNGDWDREIIDINEVRIIERTLRHLSSKQTWEEVGEINWMLENIKFHGSQDGCKSLRDVMLRLERLDNLKYELANNKKFKSQKEINPHNFRGTSGIGIGITRLGNIIWMGGGGHRLAIAKYLKLRKIPVFIKIIHEDAIINRYISKKFIYK